MKKKMLLIEMCIRDSGRRCRRGGAAGQEQRCGEQEGKAFDVEVHGGIPPFGFIFAHCRCNFIIAKNAGNVNRNR